MLEVSGLSVSTAGGIEILQDLSLAIGRGEILAVFGPSGSGKSTLLNAISGFIDFDDGPSLLQARAKWFAGRDRLLASGLVKIDGIDVTTQPVESRPIGLVQQKFSAYPHLTAFENIAFPLRCRGEKADGIAEAVRESAQLAGVELSRLGAKVKSLSGGEVQRVAIARMLAKGAQVALMDEPFSHLDQIRRSDLIALMRKLVGATDIGRMDALVLISHDWREIQYADRVLLLNARSDGCRMARTFRRNSHSKRFDFSVGAGSPYDEAEEKWVAGLSAATDPRPL